MNAREALCFLVCAAVGLLTSIIDISTFLAVKQRDDWTYLA